MGQKDEWRQIFTLLENKYVNLMHSVSFISQPKKKHVIRYVECLAVNDDYVQYLQ